MQAIKRIIPRSSFKDYNIPDSFGSQAEMIILPYQPKDNYSENDANIEVLTFKDSEEAYQLLGVTEFFNTSDDANINWEEYFDVK